VVDGVVLWVFGGGVCLLVGVWRRFFLGFKGVGGGGGGGVVGEGLRYERWERGDGSWEKWLRKEWFGRSGCVDGSGYGRIKS